LSEKGKHASCSATDQGICQGHALILIPTKTPSPTLVPPTPTPTPIPPTPTPVVSSGTGGGGYGTSVEQQLEQQLFNQINVDRTAQGLRSYAWSSVLAGGAYRHNVIMTTTGCGLLHQCLGEPTPCERFKSEGVTLPACAENIDYSYISAYG